MKTPLPHDVPWLTKDGDIDIARFPIDSILKQAISDDRQQARGAVEFLGVIGEGGRSEAGVFLIGLLMACGDDWERRSIIVHALRRVRTEACAAVLFGELRRVKSTNTTRRYLKEVIDALASMPPKLVVDGFEDLAQDTSFTHRMRSIFRGVLEDLLYEQRRGQGTP